MYQNGTAEQGRSEEEDEVKIVQPKIFDLSCRRIKPVAWLVLLGDTLHNFADGLALGAAVAQSIPLGISTMIALIFHELPHELGEDGWERECDCEIDRKMGRQWLYRCSQCVTMPFLFPCYL